MKDRARLLWRNKDPRTGGLDLQLRMNPRVLNELQIAGADLARSTNVRNYINFRSESAALAFVAEIQTLTFQCSLRLLRPEDGVHTMVVEREMVPDPTAIDLMVRILFEVSARHEGEYDGWEAAVLSTDN